MTRHRGWATAQQAARVIVAIVAADELRSLLVGAQRAAHLHLPATLPLGSATFWAIGLLAIGAGLLLREMARGLVPPRPDRSGRLAVTWACCSAGLLGMLYARGVGAGGFAGHLPSIAVALTIGLLLAVSLQGTRWVLRSVARLTPAPPVCRHACAPGMTVVRDHALPPPVPLLAGWSDRGPPGLLV